MYMWTFQVCKNKIIWFDIQNLVTLSNFEKTWTGQGFNSQPYLGFKQQMCGMFFVHFGWNPLPCDIILVGTYSCFFNPPFHHTWNSCYIKGVWMSSSSNNCPLSWARHFYLPPFLCNIRYVWWVYLKDFG